MSVADTGTAPSPFLETFGIRTIESGDGFARIAAPRDEKFSNPGDIMHGGYYCCVGSAAADAAVAGVLTESERATTLEYKINLFRPLKMGGEAIAEGRVVHRGRRSVIAVSELWGEDGKRCAMMTTTKGVSSAHEPPPYPTGERFVRDATGEPISRQMKPSLSRFFQTFGVKVQETRERFAKVVAPFHEQFTTNDGSLHPSFFGSVADCAAGPGATTVVGEGEGVSTIEYKVNLFRPVSGGELTADGYVIAHGGGTIVMHIDVLDTAGDLCGVMLTTLAAVARPA